ncbi:unnamed protein product [Bemisia tabaci]|uniref:Elongation of very long chain fatty acids protein n=1 Tax=Bemisia tabaci TaxID=7038 RepID=A0A9P0AFU9_BEMTA|nr:PREDICTED: elongation of very long chain fatty acids protein 7-like [Bemisia tabaci]XP_018901853.1 PREDICTED: elongation of very long chain fatty acids protein 7-like [Bemisia tabaci]XP_018901854.1 PREDICTED: elongation of very long chain fatty acids protein 7-like [Bemisia tabaci]XP_018901855.1 PREDICTED: elongation of very long chain fatty acids protein 7-like [Bemisia tabaci]XP_018901856.1 PREDICTED: elongation of very long chain fatty acids protein 7-like [Bemisia tabaci]CAH0391947.1 un
MAAILGRVYQTYHWLNVDLQDERTKDWPLMSSPWPTLGLLVFYNYFVQSLGPRLMKDRKPFKLDGVLIVFNVVQILANILCLYECLKHGWGGRYNWICEPFDRAPTPENITVARVVYGYFLLKVSDLLDTVFFVLRKKNGQVSFLHVYHHTGMVMLTWSATKWLPGGHETFLGLINSIVHIIMYTYYLVTIVKPEQKNNIWWKKYLTQLQMVQFFMIAFHSSLLLIQPKCDYPRWVPLVMIPQNGFLFLLFFDFYKKAYMNKKPEDMKISNGKVANGKVTENGTTNKIENGFCKSNGSTEKIENGFYKKSNEKIENGFHPDIALRKVIENGKMPSKVA